MRKLADKANARFDVIFDEMTADVCIRRSPATTGWIEWRAGFCGSGFRQASRADSVLCDGGGGGSLYSTYRKFSAGLAERTARLWTFRRFDAELGANRRRGSRCRT